MRKKLANSMYAMNTFPKALLVWGILGEGALLPSDMESRLDNRFPNLSGFSFLKDRSFNQYCHKSLAEYVDVVSSRIGFAFSLKPRYLPIQKDAGFILAKSSEVGVNSEDYLGSSGTSSRKTCNAVMEILLQLYDKGESDVEHTHSAIGLEDVTSTYRHLERLAKAKLIEHIAYPPPKGEPFAYKWIEGKDLSDVNLNTPTAIKIGENVLYAVVAQFLRGGVTGLKELVDSATYSKGIVGKARTELWRQGLVKKVNAAKYSSCLITDLGRDVVKKIIKPLKEDSEGKVEAEQKLMVEPTIEQLIWAMETYESRLRERR